MTGKSFTVQMREFAEKTKAQQRAALQASVQDVMKVAQLPVFQGGRMPVKDSHLRNSLVSELNGAQLGEGPTSYTLVADAIEPGDTARFAWTAAHALRQEFGFVGEDSLGRTFNQAGKHFAEGAALQWPQIVANNVARLK